MQALNPNRIQLYLDQIGGWSLAAIITAITLTFAVAYWLLTQLAPQQGLFILLGDKRVAADFLTALYFSIVTETTLGASDVAAGALAKVLICIQVFVGLALGGMIVAKITSAQGRTLRLLSYKIRGKWVEYCTMANGVQVFTFGTIYLKDNTLRFDGENYGIEGNPLGFFRAELLDADGPTLRFHYSNRDSSTIYFAEGIMSMRFYASGALDSKTELWSCYQATTHDFLNNIVITYEGNRPSSEEVKVFTEQNRKARKKVIESYFLERDASQPTEPGAQSSKSLINNGNSSSVNSSIKRRDSKGRGRHRGPR